MKPATAVPKVFIIHGHDEAKRRELKDLLTNEFKLEVVIMQEKPGKSRTLIEKFEQEAVECNAAIAVMTPDDLVEDSQGRHNQPRPNVIYELGWFGGKFGRNRTLMVVKQGTKIPSDLGGIERIEFLDNISEKLIDLRGEIDEWRSTATNDISGGAQRAGAGLERQQNSGVLSLTDDEFRLLEWLAENCPSPDKQGAQHADKIMDATGWDKPKLASMASNLHQLTLIYRDTPTDGDSIDWLYITAAGLQIARQHGMSH